jgi:transcriptional regulator with GAF, ATPase, and Fis domain
MNLEAMQGLMLAIAGADSTDDVLKRVVDGIAECGNVALCRIWLVRSAKDAHGEARWLQLAASAGNLRDARVDSRRLDGRFSRFEIGDRKVGRVAADGVGVLLTDITRDNAWIANPDWIASEGIVSFAAQPLVARGATLGVLGLFDRTRLPDADFRWLRTFADHAAVSIASARAYEEIERLHRQLELENEYLRTEVTAPFSDIHGSSPALQKVLRQIEMVAPTDATVLILGESGVGKELVARAIHERSARRERPLIKVNCGSIPGELFESEFFGHVKGSFTGAMRDRVGRFELANGGTLFLDEVGEIPLAHASEAAARAARRATFERVGDEKARRVDVRVIAATNRDLSAEASAGPLPRRPLLPPQRVPDRRSAAARTARGHRATRRAFRGALGAGLERQEAKADARAGGTAGSLLLARKRAGTGPCDRAGDDPCARRCAGVPGTGRGSAPITE